MHQTSGALERLSLRWLEASTHCRPWTSRASLCSNTAIRTSQSTRHAEVLMLDSRSASIGFAERARKNPQLHPRGILCRGRRPRRHTSRELPTRARRIPLGEGYRRTLSQHRTRASQRGRMASMGDNQGQMYDSWRVDALYSERRVTRAPAVLVG